MRLAQLIISQRPSFFAALSVPTFSVLVLSTFAQAQTALDNNARRGWVVEVQALEDARASRGEVLARLGWKDQTPLPNVPTGLGQEEDFALWQSQDLAEVGADRQLLAQRVALHLKVGEKLLGQIAVESVLSRDPNARREANRIRQLAWRLFENAYFTLWMRARSPQLAAEVYRAFIWPEIPLMAREPELVGAPGESADLPQMLQDGALLFETARRPEERLQCLSLLSMMGAALGREDKSDWAKFRLAELALSRGDRPGALALLRQLKNPNVAGLARWGAQLEKKWESERRQAPNAPPAQAQAQNTP